MGNVRYLITSQLSILAYFHQICFIRYAIIPNNWKPSFLIVGRVAENYKGTFPIILLKFDSIIPFEANDIHLKVCGCIAALKENRGLE